MSLKTDLHKIYLESQEKAFEKLKKQMTEDFKKVASKGHRSFSYPLEEIPMALIQLVEMWLAVEGITVHRVNKNDDGTVYISISLFTEMISENTQYKGFGL